jgi:DNA repair exonuclease SbcCD ATPase subunit
MDTTNTDTDTDTDTPEGVNDKPAIERTSLDDFRRLFDLINAISSEKNLKSRAREFQRSEARAVAAQEQLAARERKCDAREAALDQRETKLDARAAKLAEGEAALVESTEICEEQLKAREQRIWKLEDQWKFVGEDDDVARGFRAAQFSALMKARAAYGVATDEVTKPPALPPDHWHDFKLPPDVTLTRG